MTHDHSAEQELLKVMLRHPDVYDMVADRVRPELFTSAMGQIVFNVGSSMRAAGSEITFVTLTRSMTQGDLNAAGGPGVISTMFTDPALPTLVSKWVLALEDAFIKRETLVFTEKIAEAVIAGASTLELSQKWDEMNKKFQAPEVDKERIEPIGRLLGKMVDDMEDAKNGKQIEYPTTGLPLLDYKIEGICPSTYMIIAAETSGGKTALALQFARQHGIKDRSPTLVVTYEMPKDRLTKRIMAADSGVGMKTLKTGTFDSGQLAQMELSMARVVDAPLYIMDSVHQFKIAELRSYCRNAHRKLGLTLIVVDYLQLIPPTNPKDSRERQVAEISFQLQKMAQELGICVISMSQVNDDGLLRESRAIGHDADVVMVIEGDKEEPERVLHIIKNRDGELGKIDMIFDGLNQTFRQAK